MGVLGELGLTAAATRVMLIDPPDSALAEAGRLSPRPTIASTLQVAEPAAQVAWWPERRLLEPATLSRLRWLLQNAGGEAWLIVDPGDEGIEPRELRQALIAASFTVLDERPLGSAGYALCVVAG